MVNKQSLINWLIVNNVDMTNNRIILPEGWRWSNKTYEGFYAALSTESKIKQIVNMQDVALEIMNRLRRGNVRYDRLFETN